MPTSNNADSPESCYKSGMKSMRSSDWAGAIAHFTRAIELNPNYIPAYTNRGASKNAMGDIEGALADLNKVLALDPKAPGIKEIIRIISKKAQRKPGSGLESV